MQFSRKIMLGLALVIIAIAVYFFIMWLKPHNPTASDQNAELSTSNLNATESALQSNSANPAMFGSASQRDIQVNCQIQMDSGNRLLVNENTKNCFEFFITQYGEKDLAQIKTDFQKFADAQYQNPLLAQLSDLWGRYLQYREQLGQVEAPNNAEKDSAQYYQSIFSNMHNLRKQFFSDYEIEGLFGTEDIYNDYTLARMKVLEDKNLTETEKAQKLKQLFDQLPDSWKENLQQISQLDDLRKLTSDIKSRGGTAEEIHQMRTHLVGAEATQRLETLDSQRSQFKTSVNQYLAERDSILKGNMSDSAKQAAIQQLRSQNFTSNQEQLRLQTFETIHDQGGKLPYAD